MEAYWSIAESPININSDEIEQLADLKIISIFQLESIKNYRKNYGDFQFWEELYEVEGLDRTNIEMIRPLICFKEQNPNKNIIFIAFIITLINIKSKSCLVQNKIFDRRLLQKLNF